MPLSLEGWSPAGIASATAIIAGLVLIAAYAVRRGLVHRELDALEPDPNVELDLVAAGRSRTGARDGTRTLGLAGAGLLAVGLALGVATAVAGWGGATGGAGGQGGAGSGGTSDDCAQSWTGCPHATVQP